MRVLIATGEVSGDSAGAALAQALARRDPSLSLVGIGGERMAAAGVEVDCATSHLGTVGVSEAVAVLPALARAFLAVRARVRATPPDVAVLIGNDVFSVLLGRWLRAHGVPTVSFFPPQVWIWGAVAGSVVRSFDTILTCFPQEHAVYTRAAAGRATTVTFVGHHLASLLSPPTAEAVAAARSRCGLEPDQRAVGLLPGSRRHEVRSLAPLLLAAAETLLRQGYDLRFLVPLAEPGLRELVAREVDRRSLAARVLVGEGSHDMMRAADLVVLASGTASLEAALLGVPMVIVYRVSAFTHAVVWSAIRLGLMRGDTVGLPNLILGRAAVPELTQARATAAGVAREVAALLDDPARVATMRRALAEVRERLAGGDSLELAADAALALGGRGRELTARCP